MEHWDGHLQLLHAGQVKPDIEYTVREVVGAAPVSIEDLKYACAIVSGVGPARRRESRRMGTHVSCMKYMGGGGQESRNATHHLWRLQL